MIIKIAILVAAIVVMIVAAFFWFRREKFAEYPVPNDFMKIYYSNIAEDPAFVKKFPYWGSGSKAGLRCRKPNNVGCDTMWISGQLMEITPTLKKNLECKYGMPFDKIITNLV